MVTIPDSTERLTFELITVSVSVRKLLGSVSAAGISGGSASSDSASVMIAFKRAEGNGAIAAIATGASVPGATSTCVGGFGGHSLARATFCRGKHGGQTPLVSGSGRARTLQDTTTRRHDDSETRRHGDTSRWDFGPGVGMGSTGWAFALPPM